MLKKLALVLVALLVSLAFAEILIRVMGAAPKVYLISKGRFRLSKNPKLGYEPVPLSYSGEEMTFYDYKGTSNSLGFRDVEHAVAKPAGVYRIAVLGDSIAMGLHVDRFEDTFPPILQQILRQRGVNAEVMSFAVSGYNTQQEVEIFRERGLRYRPDLVLLAYSLSSRQHLDGDILRTLLAEERSRKDGVSAARVEASPWLTWSALYRFLHFRVLSQREAHVADDPDKYLAQVAGDTVAPYFGELAALSKQDHFAVLVAVFPRFLKNFSRYRLGPQHEFAEGLAREHGFHFVDLLGPFSRCRETSSVPIQLDTFHPSPYGHRCAAAALADVIVGEVVKR